MGGVLDSNTAEIPGGNTHSRAVLDGLRSGEWGVKDTTVLEARKLPNTL